MKTPRLLLFVISFCILTIQYSKAQVQTGNASIGQVEYAAFELKQSEKVKITGHGAIYSNDWAVVVFYGWIINAQTRKVVWHQLDLMNKENDLDYGELPINDAVSLDKGMYEIYFTGSNTNVNSGWNGNGFFGNWFADNSKDDFTSKLPSSIFTSRDRVKYRIGMEEALGIKVTGVSVVSMDANQLLKSKIDDAVISILKPDHNSNIKNGFSLSAPTDLTVYAIGEARKEEQFDYAWIYDVDKMKRVWEMQYMHSDFAGGADKNIKVGETVSLPAGNYLVTYVTDDSHSFNKWNSLPPDDPMFYGITIWAKTEQDKKNNIPFKKSAEQTPVLAINQVRDHAFLSQGLKVKEPIELKLLCLGEFASDEMADGGWIINATTREVVWDMNEADLQPAGGAKKNKMFDGKIKLNKGDYIVYYATDDSHSYRDWNSGPPHEQDYWGITLWATKKEDINKVELFEVSNYKSGKVVAEILHVRDDQSRSESFTLTKDAKVRIQAVGEGVSGEMVDYGWIRNTETGKVVWEMTYRTTQHAGGAQKNRMYNDVILLPKGSYKVYYETDGSHSYRNWNSSPPREPELYGISILMEDN